MSAEIQRLQLLERCRERAADEPAETLRRIFDTESQSVGNAAASTVAFGEIESSMYKRRRRLLQLLPTDASDVAARITGTRYTECAMANSFFRGSVNTSSGGTACIFASDSQLDLLLATSALTAPILLSSFFRSETY